MDSWHNAKHLECTTHDWHASVGNATYASTLPAKEFPVRLAPRQKEPSPSPSNDAYSSSRRRMASLRRE